MRLFWAACIALVCAASGVFISSYIVSGGPASRLSSYSVQEGFLPVSVQVFGRSTETISARISFYSAEGNTIGSLERSWQGWELAMDCLVVPSGSGRFVFPYMLQTDTTYPGKGVRLFPYYTRKSVPLLYAADLSDASVLTDFKLLFAIVKTEVWMPDFLGNLRKETARLRQFDAGTEYYLWLDTDGSLSFRTLE